MGDALAYLTALTNWEPRLDQAGLSCFSLERMDRLLAALGRPDEKLRFVHVAGSKGKGSVCVFLAEILRAAGYRTGLYTSPHLYALNERMRILEPGLEKQGLFEGSISTEDLDDRVRFYKADIERLRSQGDEVTFYEVITALAVSWFAARQCKIVVLETGLGGRLDATNCFETSVAGITPVGLEHTSILGDSLAAIAGEKAGIIKSVFQRVVLAAQSQEALDVLKEHCARLGINPVVVADNFPVHIVRSDRTGVHFTVEGRRPYGTIRSSLLGQHQAANAAMAVALAEECETFGFCIDEQSVLSGIAAAHWPVRFEIMGGNPEIVLDAAHTAESAAICAAAFNEIFPHKKAVLVFGISNDKPVRAIAAALATVSAHVIVTQANHPRSRLLDAAQGADLFPGLEVRSAPDVPAALAAARVLAGNEGVVLVAGSLFLAAEARKLSCTDNDKGWA